MCMVYLHLLNKSVGGELLTQVEAGWARASRLFPCSLFDWILALSWYRQALKWIAVRARGCGRAQEVTALRLALLVDLRCLSRPLSTQEHPVPSLLSLISRSISPLDAAGAQLHSQTSAAESRYLGWREMGSY